MGWLTSRKYCRWINVSENYAVSIFRFDPKEERCFFWKVIHPQDRTLLGDLTKVLLKEQGQQIRASPRCEVRNLNGRVSGSGVSKLSVLWSRAFCSWIAYKMPHLRLHRLDCSCLFSYFWPPVEYFFEKLVVAHVVTTFPLFYCIVRSSNISTLASRLTRFCARWIRFM